MACIEERGSNKKEMDIPHICVTFSYPIYVIRPRDIVKKLNKVFDDFFIHYLKKKKVEGCADHFDVIKE